MNVFHGVSKKSALNISGSGAIEHSTLQKLSIIASPEMNQYLLRKFKQYKNPIEDRKVTVDVISTTVGKEKTEN